jgi:iron complex transport system ATP-binding protein
MQHGKIVSYGPVEAVFTHQNLLKVYGIENIIKRNAFTNMLFITYLQQLSCIQQASNSNRKLNIHIIGGGSVASQILPNLRNYNVSVGVVNVLDGDYDLATELDYNVLAEAPFSPISPISEVALKDLLKHVDLVVLTSIPFGIANVKNLEIISEFKGQIFILEESPITDRDFTEGKATFLYNQLLEKTNVRKFAIPFLLLTEIIQFEVRMSE